MDTGDLDQLEKQVHELLHLCANLHEENETLKKALRLQDTEIQTLTLEREATDEKVSYLLTCLGASEPHNE